MVSTSGVRADARFLYDPRPLSPAKAGNSTPMPPIHLNSSLRRTLALAAAVAAAIWLSGCVYRPTIQQGNLLQLDEIDQVKVGMTRSQVRYVLGTPMVSDPFQPDRWDYVYTLQKGNDKHVDRAHFVVLFEEDKVVRVDRLDLPEESEVAKRVRAERDKRAAAEAKAAESSGKPAAPAGPGSPVTTTQPAPTPTPEPTTDTPTGGG
jgi:outer membrane protein assembly factor BamE